MGDGVVGEAREIAEMLCRSNIFRIQCRIDSFLERHNGDKKAATESAGIGISYLFALDLKHAMEKSLEVITNGT